MKKPTLKYEKANDVTPSEAFVIAHLARELEPSTVSHIHGSTADGTQVLVVIATGDMTKEIVNAISNHFEFQGS